MNSENRNLDIDADAPSTRLSFAHRLAEVVLPAGSLLAVLSGLTAPFRHPYPIGLGILCTAVPLGIYLGLLRWLVLPRVSRRYVDLFTLSYIGPGFLIATILTVSFNSAGVTPSVIAIIFCLALTIDSSRLSFALIFAACIFWIFAMRVTGLDTTNYNIHVLVVAPALALTIRLAVFDVYSKLVESRERQQQLLSERDETLASFKKEHEERLVLERQLYESQRRESLGILAGGIAHDFNNFLMAIVAFAETIESNPHSDAVEELASEIKSASFGASDICKQMLHYSGKSVELKRPIVLNDLINETRMLLQAALPKCIQLQCHTGERLLTIGDPSQLQQCLINIVTNAAESMAPENGIIRLELSRFSREHETLGSRVIMFGRGVGYGKDAREFVRISITDTGCGMDDETMARVFDPYFTTKPSGHGLGLAVSLGIIQGHDGAIWVSRNAPSGMRFDVMLPLHVGEPESSVEDPKEDPLPEAVQGKILIVDDEEMVRNSLRRLLTTVGWTCLTTKSAEEVEQLLTDDEAIDVVLLDYSMPAMSGLELLRHLRESGMQIPVILCSGCDLPEDVAEEAEFLADRFLKKPYELEQLLEVITTLAESTPT